MVRNILGLLGAIIGLPIAAVAQIAPTPTTSAAPSDLCSQGLSAVVSRPTQTTSACVVKRDHILIESGFQAQSVTGSGGSYAAQFYPNGVIRIGTVIPRVELDVVTPNAIRSAGMTYASDIGFGVKYQAPATSMLAYGMNAILTMPTGSDPTAATNPNGLGSSNGVGFSANVNVQGSLGKVVGYGASLSYNSLAFPVSPKVTTRYSSFIPSLTFTFALPGSTTFFIESYRQSNGEGPGTNAHTWFDAGFAKDIGKAQYDVEVGTSNGVVPIGGGAATRRRYIGFGISYGF